MAEEVVEYTHPHAYIHTLTHICTVTTWWCTFAMVTRSREKREDFLGKEVCDALTSGNCFHYFNYWAHSETGNRMKCLCLHIEWQECTCDALTTVHMCEGDNWKIKLAQKVHVCHLKLISLVHSVTHCVRWFVSSRKRERKKKMHVRCKWCSVPGAGWSVYLSTWLAPTN